MRISYRHRQRLLKGFLGLIAVLLIFLLTVQTTYSQPDSNSVLPSAPAKPAADHPQTTPEGAVQLGGQRVFVFTNRIGPLTPVERAQIVSTRLQRVADDPQFQPGNLRLKEEYGGISIATNNEIITFITPADAKAANRPIQDLANERLGQIKQAIRQYREDYSLQSLAKALLSSALATVLLGLVLRFFFWAFRKLLKSIDSPQVNRFLVLRFNDVELVPVAWTRNAVLGSLKFIRFILLLNILNIYIIFVLRSLPWTKYFAVSLLGYILTILQQGWQAFIDYLPNLLSIVVIGVITYYLISFTKVIFDELSKGGLSIPGFYPEWAEPTYKLVLFLTLATAAVVISQYLPGFRSPAAQGISIFFGVLLSLGGASSVANIVSGVILIYTRAFRVGDVVNINDVMGEVIEKSLLVTRIRTPHQVVVTFPNSAVATSLIRNFSTSAQEEGTGLILQTTITLGYDIPWRKVHQTLVEAALRTGEILSEPQPFVWQTSLNDFHISYQLNAFTRSPKLIPFIYSELHQHIQDCCNEAGIEILSPAYSALRDGNPSTIPASYLPNNYIAPGFNLTMGQQPQPPQKNN